MYDFCFTPLYAIFLALAGTYGYFSKGSVASLGAGVGSAITLSILTYISFQFYKRHQVCKPAVLLSLLTSSSLTYTMYAKFVKKAAVHTGLLAFVSGLMSAYYVWNLFCGPKPSKPAAKKHQN